MIKTGITSLFAVLLIIFVTGCKSVSSQIVDALQVSPDDNGFLALCLNLESDTPVVDGTGRLSRLEFPLGFDTSQLTPDNIRDLLGCP